MLKNVLKAKLLGNEAAVGTFLSVPAPSLAEVAGVSGADFVVIDMEHSPVNMETVENCIRAAEVAGISPIVRMTDSSRKAMSRVLDIGAHGVKIPMISTAEQAREVVDACKYQPLGNRGAALGRAARWGTVPGYFNKINDEVMIILMVETKEGVENVEEIAMTKGVDCIFVGTVDLSQSYGIMGQITAPVIEEAIVKVQKACQKAGIIAGITTQGGADSKRRIEQGYRYISVMNDMRMFQAQFQSVLAEIFGDAAKGKGGAALN